MFDHPLSQDGGDGQSCLMWAYERGFDDILSLLKRKLRSEDSSSEGSGSGSHCYESPVDGGVIVLNTYLQTFICFGTVQYQWINQGAGKRPGQWKKKKSKKNLKKIRKKIKKIVPVPIYVFVDSEQKAEFKAKIKPCSHQLNCMKLLL